MWVRLVFMWMMSAVDDLLYYLKQGRDKPYLEDTNLKDLISFMHQKLKHLGFLQDQNTWETSTSQIISDNLLLSLGRCSDSTLSQSPHPVLNCEPWHRPEEAHFCPLSLQSHSFSPYPELMVTGEGRIVDHSETFAPKPPHPSWRSCLDRASRTPSSADPPH